MWKGSGRGRKAEAGGQGKGKRGRKGGREGDGGTQHTQSTYTLNQQTAILLPLNPLC